MKNLETIPYYAGLAGVRLTPEMFDLGYGVVLSRTFAHLTAPYIMAFAPAEPGKPHPAPWSAVKGGFGLDLYVQLHIPTEFKLPKWFDRLNTVWWIAALIRLRTSPAVIVPVVADRPFSDIPAARGEAGIWPVEIPRPRLVPMENPKQELDEADLIWIRENWLRGGALMNQKADFNTAFQAFDFCSTAGSTALALISLWGALEQLFSPAKQELRFRVSASISAFLEPAGKDRLALHKRILKLYDARSQVAHSTGGNHSEPLIATYTLMRRILVKMLEESHVPSREEIEQLLFGCEISNT